MNIAMRLQFAKSHRIWTDYNSDGYPNDDQIIRVEVVQDQQAVNIIYKLQYIA